MVTLLLLASILFTYRGAIPEAVSVRLGNVPSSEAKEQEGRARYRIQVVRLSPMKLRVNASLPVAGAELMMATTRPGDLESLQDRGWPLLVSNLRVTDLNGTPVPVTSAGTKGWRLPHDFQGRLTVTYNVDYAELAAHDWPAPYEAAFADANTFLAVGRSLFLTTPRTEAITVVVASFGGWRPVIPWQRAGTNGGYEVSSVSDLTDNLVVLTRSVTDTITVGPFQGLIVALGPWRAARPEVRRVLRAVIPQYLRLLPTRERIPYALVLLPMAERRGEAYRNSFALSMDTQPSAANRPTWGSLLAHEIFHHWNGLRMTGTDYASTQWFQEGFTEYVANVSMLSGHLVSPDDFLEQLSSHFGNYRQLTTALDAGERKGPPLYSGGALVAFIWDVRIREATHSGRNLGDVLRTLWRITGEGSRQYAWQEIREALQTTAQGDWEDFYRSYVKGTAPLPLARALALAGLRFAGTADSPRVEIDPLASDSAKNVWRSLVAGWQIRQ